MSCQAPARYSHRTNLSPIWESFINISCEWIQNHPPSTAPPTFNSEFRPIMKLPWFSGSEETLISTAQDSASTPKALPLDAAIPPALPGRARTLILCFDGTGDKWVHLFHCLKRTDICYSRDDTDVGFWHCPMFRVDTQSFQENQRCRAEGYAQGGWRGTTCLLSGTSP